MNIEFAIAGFVLSLFIGLGGGLLTAYKMFFQPMKEQFRQISNHQTTSIEVLKNKVATHDAYFERLKTDLEWIKKKLETR